MKKRILTGAAAALTAAVSLGACGMYGPPPETNPAVYGPPEYFGVETTEETTTEMITTEDTFDPELTEVECVYGPPEWFDFEETTADTTSPASETSIAETTTQAETTTTTTAATTTTSAVTTTTMTTTTTTTSDTEDGLSIIGQFINDIFDPESNDPVDVYGPPEWFEE